MAWAVAEGDHARRADDPEPAIDREAAARLRGMHRACASIASALGAVKHQANLQNLRGAV